MLLTQPESRLFVYNDRVCLFDLAKVMHENIEGSQLVPIEQAGHGFYFEERERVNSELIKFID
jgi:non-heme chloroperoxidase